MREIKFRAWQTRDRSAGFMNYEPFLCNSFGELSGSDSSDVLMQFTGLLDKNGKEIYEGDIMRHLANYPRDYQEMYPHKKHGFISGPIEWSDGYWFIYKTDDNRDILLTKREAESYEVIGNIYENSDLLK